MPEIKLHQPLPELDTARLRPGLRARIKRSPAIAAQAEQSERATEPKRPKT